MATRAERQLLAAQRRTAIVQMHTVQKMTFEAIGAQLGITPQGAHAAWKKALADMPQPQLIEYRTEAVRFCDQMVSELLIICRHPDTTARSTAELHRQVCSWEERKAKLLGLDQPVRKEITVLTEDVVDAALRKAEQEHNEFVAMVRSTGIDPTNWEKL
jgi:hypothetical protein